MMLEQMNNSRSYHMRPIAREEFQTHHTNGKNVVNGIQTLLQNISLMFVRDHKTKIVSGRHRQLEQLFALP